MDWAQFLPQIILGLAPQTLTKDLLTRTHTYRPLLPQHFSSLVSSI